MIFTSSILWSNWQASFRTGHHDRTVLLFSEAGTPAPGALCSVRSHSSFWQPQIRKYLGLESPSPCSTPIEPPPWPTTAPTLRRRGVSALSPPVTDVSCRWICMLAACGCGPSGNMMNRRADSPPTLSPSPFSVWNQSSLTVETLDEVDWNYLRKCAGGFPEKDDEWTRSKLDSFLPAAMETPYYLNDGSDAEGIPKSPKARRRR